MHFQETPLQGVWLIKLSPHLDERGFFMRSWCQQVFAEQGLNAEWLQTNLSFNQQKGTLRGMHYQLHPHEETKLVTCLQGAIYDVVVDLRKDSPSYQKWFAVELSEDNHQMLYIPGGCAHGFQTLRDQSLVFYYMNCLYHPESASGFLWNDPTFLIEWPLDQRIVSDKDLSWPLF